MPKQLFMSDYDGTWEHLGTKQYEVVAIVTGNSFEDADKVLSDDTINIPVFFNPLPKKEVDLLAIINQKADVINKSGCTDFWENQKEQVQMLTILCPKCKIHETGDPSR